MPLFLLLHDKFFYVLQHKNKPQNMFYSIFILCIVLYLYSVNENKIQ